MRILHVSPTYFHRSSFLGGGERYAYELARAAARSGGDEVVFLSFAERRARGRDGALQVELLRRRPIGRGQPLATAPLAPAFFAWIRWAEVVHCHQVRTFVTDVAVLVGRLLGRKVFVTDLGGGHRYALSAYLPLLPRATGLLLLSAYSARLWARAPTWQRPRALHVVYGGVDPDRFTPGGPRRPGSVLFVGRLLPHKGLEYLIEAIGPPYQLDIVGQPYDPQYAAALRARAQGRPIRFHADVSDGALVDFYRSAMATVVPSVYRTSNGLATVAPELLGLVALESMACGTPVVATAVGSLPEIVRHGDTGFVVPPNDPAAIRAALDKLARDPERVEIMGRRGREQVLARFTWVATAARCRAAYVGTS